jgi:hypothetical protein
VNRLFRNFFRNIKCGVINIFLWLPVIWKDRYWDYTFIYHILRRKLYLTEKKFRNANFYVGQKKDADKMKICINALDRLIEDRYDEHAFKKHDEKWGKAEFNFEPKDDKTPEYKQCIITHKNVQSEEDDKKERKDFKRAVEHEDMLRQQDLDLLFNTMRKHIRGWWE